MSEQTAGSSEHDPGAAILYRRADDAVTSFTGTWEPVRLSGSLDGILITGSDEVVKSSQGDEPPPDIGVVPLVAPVAMEWTAPTVGLMTSVEFVGVVSLFVTSQGMDEISSSVGSEALLKASGGIPGVAGLAAALGREMNADVEIRVIDTSDG